MKRIMIGFIAAVSIVFSGCGDKQEKKEPSDTAGQEISSETEGADVAAGENLQEELDENVGVDENEVDGNSVLSTEDGSVKISVSRPEGFEEVEYSSEQQVVFQRMGADGTSSTQINLRLMTEDENAVFTTAKQEVEYLLSANTDEQGATVGEVQALAEGERQWSFFSYSLAGEEGYRLWTSLSNGCILSCAVENIGSGLEPLTPESLVSMLSSICQI